MLKILSGYNLISSEFDSDNALKSYYTSGKIANQTKVANTFSTAGNIINNANSSYERLGSASASNTTITEATYTTGYKYVFTRASESVKIRARIYFEDPNNELESFKFAITLRSSSNTTIQTTSVSDGGAELQHGYNDVTYSFDTSIGVNDYLWFGINAFPNSGFSTGSLSGNVTIDFMTIETDTVASE